MGEENNKLEKYRSPEFICLVSGIVGFITAIVLLITHRYNLVNPHIVFSFMIILFLIVLIWLGLEKLEKPSK